MENQSGSDEPKSPQVPVAPPRRPAGNGKWYAVIAVLIVVIAALGVLGFYHPVTVGSTSTASVVTNSATLGSPFNLTVTTNGKFNSMDIYWGDGHETIVPWSGTDKVSLAHTYNNPGTYLIYYVVNFSSGTTYSNSNNLIPVVTNYQTSSTINPNAAVGQAYLLNNTDHGLFAYHNGTVTLKPGVNISALIGFYQDPQVGEVIAQTANLYYMDMFNNSYTLPYYFNTTQERYLVNSSAATWNITNLSQGFYQLEVTTQTGQVYSQTYTVPTTVTNTSMVKVHDVTTYNKTYTAKVAGAEVMNTTLELGYMTGTWVTNYAKTNLTYDALANVSYTMPHATPTIMLYQYDNMTYVAGDNMTFTHDTNVTFMSNTSAKYYNASSGKTSTVTFNGSSYTASYMIKAGSWMNFTKTAELEALNNTDVKYNHNSYMWYSMGDMLEYMDQYSNTTYNMNTTLSYTNSQTTVNYTNESVYVSVMTFHTGTTTVTVPTGTIDTAAGVYSTEYYIDIPVFSQPALNVPVFGFPSYTPVVSGAGTYTAVELETGGYKSLDPAIEYDTVSYEILLNTLQTLVMYKGNSSSSFEPMLAQYLPNETSGGVNLHYHNYTMKTPWGTTYKVNETPYQNYTFHIRSNATWQNGAPVTAWDVMYSITRTLLFDAGTPGTPGWIQAQYLLPGNYYTTNTFYNITTNITVNNATNNITFHFQKAMSPTLVYEILGQVSGAAIASASWLIANGAGITWSPAGFQAYKAHGNSGDYNTYVQNNVLADGPFMIQYIVPSQEVVLEKNPNFRSPGSWYPAAQLSHVVIQWVPEETTTYLDLKSGIAQSATIPSSSWNQVQALEKAGLATYYSFPTLSIFWYNFNAQVNVSMAQKVVYSGTNMPSALFVSHNVRLAFAYSYNYPYYFAQQIGNSIYNTTFAVPYAGMLPKGMAFAPTLSANNRTLTSQYNGNVTVPVYNMTMAKQYWYSFIKSPDFKALGLSQSSSGNILYKGKPLVIPIVVDTADPTDLAGATTWATNLMSIINGSTFVVTPLAFPTILGYQVQGANPMPVYFLGWAPDYPYPTDYLGPMGLPTNTSLYPGANEMTPYWFTSSSDPLSSVSTVQQQAAVMKEMINEYKNGSAATSAKSANEWFNAMNNNIVNLTWYVYLYQSNQFWIHTSKIPNSHYAAYESNIMTGGGGDQMYNYYPTTA